MAIEQIHWILRDSCNCNCPFCFSEKNRGGFSDATDKEIANLLVRNQVKKVTVTGGEPIMAKGLRQVLEILKYGGVETRLHTNGILLEPRNFSGLVDEIAIPVDSIDQKIQTRLRGNLFWKKMGGLRLVDMIWKIRNEGIGVRLHSVCTSINCGTLPNIYQSIQTTPFKHWSVFEYNNLEKSSDLYFTGSLKKGQTDGLMAKFFLMESKIRSQKDDRIKFVAKDEDRGDYLFLNPGGEVGHFCEHSKRQTSLGNIFRDGLTEIGKRWEREINEPTDSEWFFERRNEWPLWRRIYEGNCEPDELEQIQSRYWPRVEELIGLVQSRQ